MLFSLCLNQKTLSLLLRTWKYLGEVRRRELLRREPYLIAHNVIRHVLRCCESHFPVSIFVRYATDPWSIKRWCPNSSNSPNFHLWSTAFFIIWSPSASFSLWSLFNVNQLMERLEILEFLMRRKYSTLYRFRLFRNISWKRKRCQYEISLWANKFNVSPNIKPLTFHDMYGHPTQ